MGQRYAETRDAAGRVTIEMNDDAPAVLWIVAIMFVLQFFAIGVPDAKALMIEALVFLVIVVVYQFTRTRMRVTIDARGRALIAGGLPRGRKLPMDQVLRAQLNSDYVSGDPDNIRAERAQVHRVDLVLRSGEVVPLMKGFGQFDVEACHGLVKRINAALATP